MEHLNANELGFLKDPSEDRPTLRLEHRRQFLLDDNGEYPEEMHVAAQAQLAEMHQKNLVVLRLENLRQFFMRGYGEYPEELDLILQEGLPQEELAEHVGHLEQEHIGDESAIAEMHQNIQAPRQIAGVQAHHTAVSRRHTVKAPPLLHADNGGWSRIGPGNVGGRIRAIHI
jgi:hypothetical protein